MFSNILVFKVRCCTSAHRPIEFFNSNLYRLAHTFHQFEKSIYVLFLMFSPLSGVISFTESIIILFPIYGIMLMIFHPLATLFRRQVLLIMSRSPVIMWPAGLYMNGELAAQVSTFL